MKILGIRTAPGQLRFALVEFSNNDVALLNDETESLVKVPAGIAKPEDVLYWQKAEVDRILRQNADVACVGLKTSEFSRTETKSTRLATYLDAAVMLAAKEVNKAVHSKLYSQLGATRATVKERAEQRVGRTQKYWNEQIADAIIVAWKLGKSI